MGNQIGLVISFIFLSICIMFSYEVVSYQKSVSNALIQTNNIALQIQKNGYVESELLSNEVFNKIEIETFEYETYIEYKITTTTAYRCDINFFDFSNEDIVTSVVICSNLT